MAPSMSRPRGCQTVSKAELQKAFSALLMSQEPGALYAKLRDPRCELEESELCSTHGVVKDLLHPQDGSASGNIQKKTLGGCLGKWIVSHPKVTVVLLVLLVGLVPAPALSGLALAAVLAERSGETEPLGLQVLNMRGVGDRGSCDKRSKDERSWDQAQARWSKLGASLALLGDEERELFLHFAEDFYHWLRLGRQDQDLQEGAPVQDNAGQEHGCW